ARHEALEIALASLGRPLKPIVALAHLLAPARRILHVIELGDLAELVERGLHERVRPAPAVLVLEAIERDHRRLAELEVAVEPRGRFRTDRLAAAGALDDRRRRRELPAGGLDPDRVERVDEPGRVAEDRVALGRDPMLGPIGKMRI